MACEPDELRLLRRIAETGSDMLLAAHDGKFAEKNGGFIKLCEIHDATIRDWEAWVSENTPEQAAR